jgi:PiT family inorganic phosphate transporter
VEILLFLSSGLFLGWSLGANDAANVFGTAVGTRMVKFRSAAVVCSIFIILGATISGAGAAHTLGRLGAVNALAGSFTVALAAALATFWMTRLKIPVSTSQSIVGAIIGWNLYSASVTDTGSLTRIVITWVACPIITGVIAVILFILVRWLINVSKTHLLRLDFLTRLGLLVVGAFGSYSLGANNIANVMGVFVPDNPFGDLSFFGMVTLTGTQQLFFLGAVAIAVGVFTYSERVMGTVGSGLVKLSPVSAFVVVLSQSITLFLFASEGLENFLAGHGLPTIPLVPVSSSQAVIGAIVGLSLFRGAGLKYRVLGNISLGWIATPVMAGVIAFFLLFFMDNVFDQEVSRSETYRFDSAVAGELARQGLGDPGLAEFQGREMSNAVGLKKDLEKNTEMDHGQVARVMDITRVGRLYIDPAVIAGDVDSHWLTSGQMSALRALSGQRYEHAWQFHQALAAGSDDWRVRPPSTVNKIWNKELKKKLSFLDRVFREHERDDQVEDLPVVPNPSKE